MPDANVSPEMLQALKIIQDRPVKRGTLMVTCKGVGYAGIAREIWTELIDKGWIEYQFRNHKSTRYLTLSKEAKYYLTNGHLPPTMEEQNICTLCRGLTGWLVGGHFITCQHCNGDGLYHG